MHRAKLAVLAAALAVGCSPKNDPSPYDTSTAAAFCEAVMADTADLFGRCLRATPEFVAAMKALPFGECNELLPYVAAGRVVYDPQQGAACVAFLAGQSCAELAWDGEPGGAECGGVFRGTIAAGGACGVWDECAAGWCDTTAACQGTCVLYRTEGQTCLALGDTCAPGLVCDGQGTGRCVVPSYPGLGQACGAIAPGCAPGLWCDAGVCHAQVTTGSCLAGDDVCAAGTFCAKDSYLSPTRAECVPYVSVGDACGKWVGQCSFGSFCDATSARCAASAPLGGSCSAVATCLPPGWCDTAAGTCTAPLSGGAPCTGWDQCAAGLECDLGGTSTCTPTPVCTP